MKTSYLIHTILALALVCSTAQRSLPQSVFNRPTEPQQLAEDPSVNMAAKEAVQRLSQAGILAGYPDGKFRGNRPLTRFELVQMVFRMRQMTGKFQKVIPRLTTDGLLAVFSPPDPNLEFGDYKSAPDGLWCYGALISLQREGLVQDQSARHFGGNKPISRAELATMVARLVQRMENPPALNIEHVRFSDVDGTEWYFGSVLVAVGSGLLPEYANETFRAKQPVTRNEAVVILARLLDARFHTSMSSQDEGKRSGTIPANNR